MKRFSAPRFFRGMNLTAFTMVMIFLYIPILILIIFSFNDAKIITGWKGFTTKYYVQLFNNQNIKDAFWNTMLIAGLSTLISTTLGILTALGLEYKKFSGRKIMQGLIYVPLVIPDILMGVSLALLFNFTRVTTGMFTVLIAHVTFCISYTVIVIQSRLEGFDYSLVEAAQDLGAKPSYIFWKIKFPLMMPGIIAAGLLAFTLSIDDFIITFFTSGRGFDTLPIYVEGTIRRGTITTINSLSTLMIAFTLFLVVITKRVRKIMISAL
ncbi:MAG: ABC transporter permease [Candidatus Cloacimonetes bacterium]|jgi:spermidine/putrescine transport system permease protein|nr:ABC transporter permease [Candidatus Cloacimonadota bacterium]MDY0336885.1 ABC transporter permease [Candidatus Cloacimonadaceae bacterium]MDD2544446.1 ABC transporter permease [Candidatus Cloacimonadota bacterium]MDD3097894.1 ABC transporter permease [Candidatus Cloacimonadota bacterium]MDD3578638.1 ABC transporter permease [Candidatus Cloacimonadota bacterium]